MKIYELRVEVVGQGVWRRLEVPARMTLAGLHLTLQRAMGWTNAGLYAFETDRARYGVLNHEDEWMRDPRDTDVRVRQIGELAARTRHIDYVYEGARQWRHAIVVEGESDAAPGERYPRVVGGSGPTVLETIEPGRWRESEPIELPEFDEIALQASADAGFDAIARLLEPLGTAPLIPEHTPSPAPSPPPPRPLSSPPHVIRPAELMAACASRLGGEHPEQGLDAFVEEVAEHELVGVHDMFTRKVVLDMLRRELGPEPALEQESEPVQELGGYPAELDPEVELGLEPSEPVVDAWVEADDALVGAVDEEADDEADEEIREVGEDALVDVSADVEEAPPEEEGTQATEGVDLETASFEGVEQEVEPEDPVAEDAAPEADTEPDAAPDAALLEPMELPDLEASAPIEAPEVAQLELGAIDALAGPGEGLALGAMESLGEGVQVPDDAALSAWEEESWSMDEVEVDASLGAVDGFEHGSDALGALPSWGGEASDVGETATPLWDASLDELGAMSAHGFEAVEGMDMGARVVADEVERESFEAVDEGAREAFVAVRAEDAAPAFEIEPGLKVFPRGHALSDCLDRVPARWLDVIAEKVEVDEPRRADRARRIAEELARVEVLSELVASELGPEACALGRALSAYETPRGAEWFVEGRHASPEDEAYFTFAHEGALGELRRCGLAFVGVSGAKAELEVVVPVGVRRALQLVLR